MSASALRGDVTREVMVLGVKVDDKRARRGLKILRGGDV